MIDIIGGGIKFLDWLVGDGKGHDVAKLVIDELDKRRMIDYGRKEFQVESREKLDKLLSSGRNVKLATQDKLKREGVFDDGYRRS